MKDINPALELPERAREIHSHMCADPFTHVC